MVNSCNGCGLCCKLFYINLSREEYESGKFKTELGRFGKVIVLDWQRGAEQIC